MKGTDELSEIIRAAFLSARVDCSNTTVVNLFIVAPFERGKTSVVLMNRPEESIVLSDMTGMGLLEAILREPKATHVVVNDLTAVQGHRSNVAALTVSILNALAEEGSYTIAVPNMQHLDLKGRKIGVIASCVPGMMFDKRSWWHKSGFLSRMLVLKFDHSISLQHEIMLAISNGTRDKESKPFVMPEKTLKVFINEKRSKWILGLSHELVKRIGHSDEIGYRKQKQLRGLACGHALSYRRTSVNDSDIEFLRRCLPYFCEGKQI